MLRSFNALVLAATLFASSAIAQEVNDDGVQNSRTTPTTGAYAAADDSFDLGWIGLAGLAGLAGLSGLAKRKENARDEYRANRQVA